MSEQQFTEDDRRHLVRLCKVFDLGIAGTGVVMILAGEVGGGLVMGALGLLALLSVAVLSAGQ